MAKQAITPEKPVFLSGFGGRTRKHEGILDDLYARVVLLQQNRSFLIIQLDLTGGDRSFVNGIKRALKERFGLAEEEILINFSHTHYSVYVTGEDPAGRRGMYSIDQERWPLSSDEVDYTEDIRYFHRLREILLQLTGDCLAGLQEGTMRIGRGGSEFGVSRRLITEDGVSMRPNFAAPIDPDLTVFQLTDRESRLRGILFSYGCHPTSMSGNQISAEFPGAASRYLEAKFPEASAVFLQGCAGDVKMRAFAGDKFAVVSPEQMREAAGQLARDVIQIIEKAEFIQVEGPFAVKLIDVRLFTEEWEIADHERTLRDPAKTEYRKLRTRMVIDAIRNGAAKNHIPHWIQLVQLGSQAKIIAMEGEIPSAYALMIKNMLGGKLTVVLGYSNGVSSYIPTRRWIEEGGYEVEAVVLHGLRGPLTAETEELILGAIAGSVLLGN
jgi:hypothetical protein